MPLDPSIQVDPTYDPIIEARKRAYAAGAPERLRQKQLEDEYNATLYYGRETPATAALMQRRSLGPPGPDVRITGMYHDATMAPSAYDISEVIQPGLPGEGMGIPETSGSGGPHPPAPAPPAGPPAPPASRLAQDADPALQALFGDVQSGASSTAIPAFQPGAPRAPEFANVEGGGGSSVRGAHVMGEAARPDPGVLRVDLGDGWQDVSQGQPLQRPRSIEGDVLSAYDPIDQRSESYQVPQGGGTFSMMTAPENEATVTQASRLQDALAERAIREARGIPSEADIYKTEAAVRGRFGPAEELKFAEAEATNREIQALMQHQQKLDHAVATGRLSPADAQRLFEEARQEAAFRIQALRGGSLGAWGPNKNDAFGDLGALPPS